MPAKGGRDGWAGEKSWRDLLRFASSSGCRLEFQGSSNQNLLAVNMFCFIISREEIYCFQIENLCNGRRDY